MKREFDFDALMLLTKRTTSLLMPKLLAGNLGSSCTAIIILS